MSRRLPDGRWVHRVRRENRRFDAAWRRRPIRQPEILPCVDVAIVRVDAPTSEPTPVVEITLQRVATRCDEENPS